MFLLNNLFVCEKCDYFKYLNNKTVWKSFWSGGN